MKMIPMKVAVLWKQMGPYHLARLGALARRPELETWGLALCSREAQREWESDGIPVGFSRMTVHDGVLEETGAGLLARETVRALETLRPDALAISGYTPLAMRVAARWARRRGKVCVLMSDTTGVDRPRRAWLEAAKGWWVRRYHDASFVAGERSAAYLEGLGFPAERIWRGYDVVDNAHFARGAEEARMGGAALREKLGLPARYFLYVGRLSPEKNLPFLLSAYRDYREGAGEGAWALVLAGSGPAERALRREAESIGGVHFTGFHQVDELPAYYGLASCFVLPSRSEPWGLVVNEAMAAGLPVLVSDRCGCLPELVRPGENGDAFDPDDTEALAQLLERMSSGEMDLRRMGEVSRRIVSRYSPEAWAQALADCIRATTRQSA